VLTGLDGEYLVDGMNGVTTTLNCQRCNVICAIKEPTEMEQWPFNQESVVMDEERIRPGTMVAVSYRHFL